ncbi:Argonaute complex, subunit Arb1 [Aspergillus ambiguus]|uniref:uncharacterized protein n=1 Tax=Aspergillus ambiguus TaxID=176160 RepID=UPI003CCD6C19
MQTQPSAAPSLLLLAFCFLLSPSYLLHHPTGLSSSAKMEKEDENQDDQASIPAPVESIDLPKKPKRKKKPKSKRGRGKPTGFEDYYVDTPMTPDEYHEELSLYDPERPIIHRLEDAILRYQQRRRIESDRLAIFHRYLAYGGVDISPRMFTGVDQRDLKDMDSEQIRFARSQASIRTDYSKLPIDFDLVVRGFLTSYFPYYFSSDSQGLIQLATVTIRNFLSYLLYHDVVPEYRDNIDEARRSCNIASKELWKNQQFTAQGPGDFNMACSTLFGGFLHEMDANGGEWEHKRDPHNWMTQVVALKVVKFALAGVGTDAEGLRFLQLAEQCSLRARCLEDIHGFEVTAVSPPNAAVCAFYHEHAPDLYPVGRLYGKGYYDPGKPGYDLTPDERRRADEDSSMLEFEFFVEASLLEHCYPGMKVITPVWELNAGFHFFEDIQTAYSSIYTNLANDLLLGWTKPKEVGGGEEREKEEEDGVLL